MHIRISRFTKKIKPKSNTFVFDLGFDWRKEWNTTVSQREPSAGFSLSLKCERLQQVAALRSRLFPPKQKSGIRSATITTFTCFFAYLYLTHFSLFCRYHAGVANNRFIGCLVGSLFRKKRVSFTSRLPTRSNPTIDEKKFGYTLSVSEFFGGKSGIRTHDALPHT